MTGAVLSPGTAAAILFGAFFTFMFMRVPVAFALGLACLPVLVIEPRYADPLSLVHYRNVVVTKQAIAKLEEMWG